jgi:hypothetical protein
MVFARDTHPQGLLGVVNAKTDFAYFAETKVSNLAEQVTALTVPTGDLQML